MLVELITKNAGADQLEYGYKPRPSAVGRCIRALVYDARGEQREPFPDRALLVFEDGNWHEELLKDAIRKTVFELVELKGGKQRIQIADIDGVIMDGEIDGLITDPLGKTRLLEIKSINHFGFERLDTEPLEEHFRQANLYLHGLVPAGFDIEEAIILYKNKNTSAMKEFIIRYDPIQAQDDIEMFRSVAHMARTGGLPQRPYDYDDWHCQYCRFQKTCWTNYAEEIGKLSTDVALSEELETTARYYKELGAQETEIKKEREGLQKILKTALFDAKAQIGRAGEYIIKLSASTRAKLIPDLVPKEAYEQVPSERFTVTRIKGEDDAVHENKGRGKAAKHHKAAKAGKAETRNKETDGGGEGLPGGS